MKRINILLGGDVTSTGRTAAFLTSGRMGELWNDTQSLLDSHDYGVCNLECPLVTAGRPIRKIGPNLRGLPSLAAFLKAWGFDAVNLANNHIMDYGREGLVETMEVCATADLGSFGAGRDLEEAEAPHRVEIRGQRLSFLAATEEEFCVASDSRAGAPALRAIPLCRRIQQERERADWIIVVFHGGNEYYPLPRPGLQELCRFLVSSGADAVIGHHPHVPGGYEVYDGKPIVYSVGNLLFDSARPRPGGWESGYFVSLALEAGRRPAFRLVPYVQWHEEVGGVRRSEGREAARLLAETERLRTIIETPLELRSMWSEYCKDAGHRVLMPFFRLWSGRAMSRVVRTALRAGLLPTRYWTMSVLNRIRCESHREEFIRWAESEYISSSRPETRKWM
jgi:poly-gamma-glutamate capsule biosynthesis protein CapA/YwtB (metallophosphatase superfamily)